MVCNSPSVPHAVKDWKGAWGLGEVEFSRCTACGFVKSETHFAMSDEAWARLNVECHSAYQGSDVNPTDPRWLERMTAQRDVLSRLHADEEFAPSGAWLDWGAGDGKLSAMLAKVGVPLQSYDAYMSGPGFLSGDELTPRSFGLVISTSVFEHVRDIETLDEIEALVAPDGVFAIHTLIAEEVPSDPNWFYYQAPHVAFFTNASMDLLMERWGYRSSFYHVPSRIWFCFKSADGRAQRIAERLNAEAGREVAAAGEGFVGYWTNARLGR
jgi:hypothetical protein